MSPVEGRLKVNLWTVNVRPPVASGLFLLWNSAFSQFYVRVYVFLGVSRFLKGHEGNVFFSERRFVEIREGSVEAQTLPSVQCLAPPVLPRPPPGLPTSLFIRTGRPLGGTDHSDRKRRAGEQFVLCWSRKEREK